MLWERFVLVFEFPSVRLFYYWIAAGYLYALVSLFVGLDRNPLLPYLYFYVPVLWALWITNVLFLGGRPFPQIFLSWILIDCLMLLVVGLASIGVEDFCQSLGLAETFFITYFPVLMPASYLSGLFNPFPENYYSVFGCSGIGGAFSVWLEVSYMALPQSALVLFLARYFLRPDPSQAQTL
ncbi:MAG: hypothetical protein IPH06_00400 [Alphaproteobacteria bacterium]|nr:hypothetical protein [Alphaproteobacteria bacterium]QQS56534.1 MAG: hypothetical protein IPN28_09650 [Alphaproteobacteria bacterium]